MIAIFRNVVGVLLMVADIGDVMRENGLRGF